MIEEFKDLPPLERMRAENEYMRLKLMAERGAQIHLSEGGGPAQTFEHNRFFTQRAGIRRAYGGSKNDSSWKAVPC